jgi:hypothetical protein
MVVHGTQKLLNRLPGPVAAGSLTGWGDFANWYATAWFWRPQWVLMVHESTLFPVVVPLAPAGLLGERMVDWIELTLRMTGYECSQVDRAMQAMQGQAVQFAKTGNRSVVSVLTQFSFHAQAVREARGEIDPVQMALVLGDTPTSPLYKTHVFPRKAMGALLQRTSA